MQGLGTIINGISIILGGIIGLVCGKRLSESIQETLLNVSGSCVVVLGICGAIQEMVTVENGVLAGRGNTAMVIICMTLGGIIGEAINIDGRLESFGEWLKQKSGSQNDNRFVSGFVTASLTVCVGAMAIVGSIQDGIFADPSILITKSMLDLIIIAAMTASMGKGCMFSAIPVIILQGSVTLLSRLIQPFMTPSALSNISLTGSIMIMCVGLNLLRNRKIRVANLLPSLIFAVVWALCGLPG